MNSWYSIVAKAGQGGGSASADISIHDEIGAWGVTAKAFIAELNAIEATQINLSICSLGGDVFNALAIFNALRQHPAPVTVTVMGMAASAASVVAMAGDRIVMPGNAFMLVHDPMSGVFGNAGELRELADVLDKVNGSLVGIYVARSGQDEAKVRELLAAETLLSADEAVALGFADEIAPDVRAVAAFAIENVPEAARAVFVRQEPLPESPAGATGASAESDESAEIVALCAAAGIADLAPRLICAQAPLADVRGRIAEARAALDAITPVSNVIPAPTPAPRAAIDYAGIYAARRTTR